MGRQVKQAAVNQAAAGVGNGPNADVSGWIDLPSNAKNVHADIIAEGSPTMSLEIQAESANSKIVTLHPFSATGTNKSEVVSLGDIPHAKVRANLTAYTQGNLWVTLWYHD